MSYLNQSFSENLATRLTNKGRQRIAEGNFNIVYFQIGDSEFNYNLDLSLYSGSTVLMPFDFDLQVKYPYLSSVSEYTGTTTGATYGSVISMPNTLIITPTGATTEDWEYKKIITGDTTNLYLGTKEYFGYGTTGYTSDDIILIHYSKMGITTGNTFEFEDYISYDNDHDAIGSPEEYFNITIFGNQYKMGTINHYVNDSGITDSGINKMLYRDLVDTGNTSVGKIFIYSKIIIIDNQSIVNSLSSGSTLSVSLRPSINIEVMNMYVNLPDLYFTKTQNPTWTTGDQLMITEIGLFNENRELLVISKCTTPIPRTGTQVFNVTLDI